MAIPAYLVKVNGNTVSNVQEFTFTRGVQHLSDSIRPGTGIIRGRRPDLLPTIAIGDNVRIDVGAVGSTVFYCRVADFRIDYGEVASLDTWQIDIEDAVAALGRCTASFSWSAGSTTGTAIQAVMTGAGVTLQANPTTSPCSAQVIVNENALEVFGRLMTQEQGFFIAGGADNTIEIWGRQFASVISTYDFSDDGTGTNPIKYDALEFAGLADNYADKTIVEAAGLAQQSSGVGNYSAIFQTYNQTTGQAKDLADYLLGVYDAQVQSVSTITARWNSNTGTARSNLNVLVSAPTQLKIKFRTNTYYGIVLGATVSGLIDDVIYTYYLATPGFYTQFTLDSPIAGVLNTNRLGY